RHLLWGLRDRAADAAAAGAADRLIAPVRPALDRTPGDPRDRYEAQRVRALVLLETEGPEAAEPHFAACLDLAAGLGDRRLEAYAVRWLRQVRGSGARTEWAEVRPGVWRLPAA
ncbi:AfsR/SARP family transcriptional regulator, partial [Streptomyces bambusae]|nr:AfsR/SARP family transcriptional regulator [Streptomyces bambusae]